MPEVLEREAMARPKGRPKKSERDDVPVKVDRAIVSQARRVAEIKGLSVAEIISEAARAGVARAYLAAVKDLEDQAKR